MIGFLKDKTGRFTFYLVSPLASVAELPLFWAAPVRAPDDKGPWAGSGSDRLGSAPALEPGKKRRFQAAPAPYTNIFHFEQCKSFLDHIYRYKLLLSHVLSQQQGFPFLLAKKYAFRARAALKKAALGSGQQKNRLRLHPKSASSRRLWLRLRNTALGTTRYAAKLPCLGGSPPRRIL